MKLPSKLRDAAKGLREGGKNKKEEGGALAKKPPNGRQDHLMRITVLIHQTKGRGRKAQGGTGEKGMRDKKKVHQALAKRVGGLSPHHLKDTEFKRDRALPGAQ